MPTALESATILIQEVFENACISTRTLHGVVQAMVQGYTLTATEVQTEQGGLSIRFNCEVTRHIPGSHIVGSTILGSFLTADPVAMVGWLSSTHGQMVERARSFLLRQLQPANLLPMEDMPSTLAHIHTLDLLDENISDQLAEVFGCAWQRGAQDRLLAEIHRGNENGFLAARVINKDLTYRYQIRLKSHTPLFEDRTFDVKRTVPADPNRDPTKVVTLAWMEDVMAYLTKMAQVAVLRGHPEA